MTSVLCNQVARQIHKERRMARLSVDINGEQRTFALTDNGIQIGRALDNDIVLNHAIVSRRHAQVLRREGRFVIEDKGSLNGTFLNRRRIESGQLEDGDEVQIGKYKLTFLS